MDEIDAPTSEARALLDLAACGLMRTAHDGAFLWANQRFCSWTGYTERELVSGRRFQDLLSMGGRIFHQTHWAPLLHMQGSISEVKLEIVHRDGSSIPMVINAIRHGQAGGGAVEIAAFVARDRDKYERELVGARKRLEEVVVEITRLQAETKDRATLAEQMIGIVSHDLRNPLSSIMMGIRLLERASLTDHQQHILRRIQRSTGRANWLINDLLDFTQARLGRGLSVTLSSVELHKTIGESIEELSLANHGRRLIHEKRGEGRCLADPNRLAQLVGNLVANSLAYGDPLTPITVTSTIDDVGFGLSVHNQGEPIPAALLPKLFAPMERGTTTSAIRSVGLGLFIVSEIARAHGGVVSVESSAAAGTTFRASFPRRTAQ